MKREKERIELLDEPALRACLDAVHEPVVIVDEKRRIVHANALFLAAFPGARPGEHCCQVVRAGSGPCPQCPADAALSGDTANSRSSVTLQHGGVSREALVQASVVSPRGLVMLSIQGLDAAHQGTSEHGASAFQVMFEQDRLADIGLLVSSISHTVKNILSGLDSGLYLMGSGFERDNRHRIERGWEIVRRNTRRMKSAILDILYYSKDRPLEITEIKTKELKKEIRDIIEEKAQEHGIKWVENIDRQAGKFQGDYNAIRTMLVNLLENSIDACRVDDRKDSHFITFTCTAEGDHVIFQVSDNGLGMDRETRDKAFSLFYSTKGAKGTGLGLFMAKQTVERHGGVIHLESDFGGGASFTIRLPRKV